MTFSVRGIDYNVRIEGDPRRDRTIVLLHGFAGSSEDWDDLVPVLRDMGLAVVAPDLPGHGDTTTPAESGRCALQEIVRDLISIQDEIGIERAAWLGYSMGGRIALHLALDHPERVRSLVLESSGPGIEDDQARALRRAQDDALADRIEERGIEWFVAYWSSLPLFETQWELPNEARSALRARRLRNEPRGLALALRELGQGAHDYLGKRLGALPCRLLLIAGERDIKYVEVARRVAASVEGSVCQIVPGVGHTVHLEAPHAFAQALAVHCIVSEEAFAPASAPPLESEPV